MTTLNLWRESYRGKTLERIFFYFIVLALVFSEVSGRAIAKEPFSKEHHLHLFKPGDPGYRPKKYTIQQHGLGARVKKVFSMWVDSVICTDKSCEVIKVQLQWDALGRYHAFVLEKGSHLTKLDHVKFSPEEYEKLHAILLDQRSALGEIQSLAKVEENQSKSENSSVDGMTGATVHAIRNDVIPGAAYTCYHLWRIANGSIGEQLRKISIESANQETLNTFLDSSDEEENVFAIEAFFVKKINDKHLFEKAMSKVSSGSKEVIPSMMAYAQEVGGNASESNGWLAKIFEMANSAQRRAFIENILENQSDFREELIYGMIDTLPKLESFYEVQLFFRLCQQKKVSDEVLLPQVIKLLSHRKFFVQRRALEFLELKKRDDAIEKKIEAFRKEYRHRL